MSKQRWRGAEIGRYVLFLLLIVLGWAILAWTDYLENPLQSMRSLIEVYGILQASPGNFAPVSVESVGFFDEFDWAALPDVLYNIWFICLITAGVITANRLVVRFNRLLKTKK